MVADAITDSNATKTRGITLLLLVVAAIIVVCISVCGIATCGFFVFAAWAFAVLLFYAPGVMSVLDVRRRGELIWLDRKQCIVLVSFLAVLGALVFAYISCEQFIYYWDFGSYWYKTLGFLDSFLVHPLRSLNSVYTSVNADEYNLIISLLLSVPLKMSGGSFASFVLVVYLMFVAPSMVVFASVEQRLFSLVAGAFCDNKKAPWHAPLLGVALVCSSSLVMIPLLDGYADFASVYMLACIFFIVAYFDYRSCAPVRVAGFAFALLWIVLLRRYFLYAVVGFVGGLVAYFVAEVIANRKDALMITWGMVRSFALPGVVVAVILLVAFPGFLQMALFNNYAEAYSAYKSDVGLVGELLYVALNLGAVMDAMGLVGCFFLWRRTETRSMAALLSVSVVFSALMFWQTQDMGEQHLLIMTPFLFLCSMHCASVFLACVSNLTCKKGVVACVNGALICLIGVGLLSVMSIVPRNVVCENAYGNRSHALLIRGDLDSVYAMADSFGDGDSVYVLSSSGILNSDILAKSYINRGLTANCVILPTSHVDLRDGFPTAFFSANKIVVCIPYQTHMKEGTQHVVTDLADYVLSREGEQYALIGTYLLDDGVIANVYELTEPYSADDYQVLEDVFAAEYPSYGDLFTSRIEDYASQHSVVGG